MHYLVHTNISYAFNTSNGSMSVVCPRIFVLKLKISTLFVLFVLCLIHSLLACLSSQKTNIKSIVENSIIQIQNAYMSKYVARKSNRNVLVRVRLEHENIPGMILHKKTVNFTQQMTTSTDSKTAKRMEYFMCC